MSWQSLSFKTPLIGIFSQTPFKTQFFQAKEVWTEMLTEAKLLQVESSLFIWANLSWVIPLQFSMQTYICSSSYNSNNLHRGYFRRLKSNGNALVKFKIQNDRWINVNPSQRCGDQKLSWKSASQRFATSKTVSSSSMPVESPLFILIHHIMMYIKGLRDPKPSPATCPKPVESPL